MRVFAAWSAISGLYATGGSSQRFQLRVNSTNGTVDQQFISPSGYGSAYWAFLSGVPPSSQFSVDKKRKLRLHIQDENQDLFASKDMTDTFGSIKSVIKFDSTPVFSKFYVSDHQRLGYGDSDVWDVCLVEDKSGSHYAVTFATVNPRAGCVKARLDLVI